MRTGVGRRSKAVGRRVTLHPSFRIGALFDQPVLGWQGALQSAYTDKYDDEGYTLVGAFAPLNVLAGALPGVGPTHHAYVKQMGHLAIFGGLVHDHGGGTIHRSLGREPLITYRMSPGDKVSWFRGVHQVAKTFFEAGAREVHLPIYSATGLKSPDDLQKYTADQIPGRLLESVSFHPLGSAPAWASTRPPEWWIPAARASTSPGCSWPTAQSSRPRSG